jgi:hypothetical protein
VNHESTDLRDEGASGVGEHAKFPGAIDSQSAGRQKHFRGLRPILPTNKSWSRHGAHLEVPVLGSVGVVTDCVVEVVPDTRAVFRMSCLMVVLDVQHLVAKGEGPYLIA